MITTVATTPEPSPGPAQATTALQLQATEPELELDDADLEYVTGGLARAWIDAAALVPLQATT